MNADSLPHLLIAVAFAQLVYVFWELKKHGEGIYKAYEVLKDLADAGRHMGEIVQDIESRLCIVEESVLRQAGEKRGNENE